MSAVAALVISGVLPALGIGISALADRRLDVIGIVVLAGLLAGTLLGLTSHNARLYLLEGSVPSAVFALGCLLSLRLRRPLIFRLAVELLGPDTRKGRDVTAAWRLPAGVPDDHRGVGDRLSRRGRHPGRDRGHHVDGDRPGLLQADPLCVSPWSCPPGRSSTASPRKKAERLASAEADADADATVTATAGT